MAEERSMGIMRNKTGDILRLKAQQKIQKNRFSKQNLSRKYRFDREDLIKSNLLQESTEASEIEMTSQPIWIQQYRTCVILLKEVDALQGEIFQEKARKLRGVDTAKHQRIIESLLEEATQKLNCCEKTLKSIQLAEDNPINKKTHKSMLMGMAVNIREQANKLRLHREEDLKQQKELKRYTKSVFDESNVEEYFSEAGLQAMQKKQNAECINKLVQSIYALNAIYKDLQGLVIEQGSLLDRIDENIETTVVNVKKANQHLAAANRRQDSKCFAKARCGILVLISLCLMIILIKHL